MKDNCINEDSLLWSDFLTGNNEAYSTLYRRFVQVLFLFGLHFTTDRELVKDCIQDVFEKLFRDRNKLNQTDNVKIYLLVVMKNALLNKLKREKKSFQYMNADTQMPSEEKSVADELEEKENEDRQQQQIHEIFSHLTSKQREILYYRYIENLDIKEIAILTNMNYQSVINLIHRSVKRAREKSIPNE